MIRALQAAGAGVSASESYFRAILDGLPAAVYTTDAAGRIVYYNTAAAELWGRRPPLGQSEWCGSWNLYWPDGRPLPHSECPMALAIKQRRPIRGVEAVAERPDGSRVPFMPYPTPLFDDAGELIGAVNMLADLSERKVADVTALRLAAIVTHSDDAIISKDLDGVITSWNAGAERLFGYSSEEAVGRPVLMLIPEDRTDEEPEILARLRRGEHIDHYETVRLCKDGSLVDVSLSVSPIIDAAGRVIGASKIARDITERRQAAERQVLLLREMNHRVKNLFALAGGLLTLSARTAQTPKELAVSVRDRLNALARAHDLTLPKIAGTHVAAEALGGKTTLHRLIETIVAPFEEGGEGADRRLAISGPDVALSNRTLTSFALLIHEIATNAAKYGALSVAAGRVAVDCADEGEMFAMTWTEMGGPLVHGEPKGEGFGAVLAQMTMTSQLHGEITHDWRPEGLAIRLAMPKAQLV